MASRAWVTFKPRPHARCRLLCVHHAGGAASFFKPWADLLPDDIELVAAQLPGRERRYNEPFAESVDAVIDDLFATMAPFTDRPYLLFGHSFGAILAYELARRATAQRPDMLIVSAYPAPQFAPPIPDIEGATNEQWRMLLRQMGGSPDDWRDYPELLEMVIPRLRADYRLAAQYGRGEPPRDFLPIIAWGASDDPLVPVEQLLAWRTAGYDADISELFTGGHFYLRDALPALIDRLAFWAHWHREPHNTSVGVHQVSLDVNDDSERAARNYLQSDELVRADRYVRPVDRRRFTVARAALRHFLGPLVKLPPNEVPIRLGPGGKPRLATALGSSVRFNVTHTGDTALIAIGQNRELGVDAETIRHDLDCDGLAERYFAPAEVAGLRAVPEPQQRATFFRLWSRKEAFVKALGLGLTVPLEEFAVPVANVKQFRLTDCRYDPQQMSRWTFHTLTVSPDIAGCLVVNGPPCRVVHQLWRPPFCTP